MALSSKLQSSKLTNFLTPALWLKIFLSSGPPSPVFSRASRYFLPRILHQSPPNTMSVFHLLSKQFLTLQYVWDELNLGNANGGDLFSALKRVKIHWKPNTVYENEEFQCIMSQRKQATYRWWWVMVKKVGRESFLEEVSPGKSWKNDGIESGEEKKDLFRKSSTRAVGRESAATWIWLVWKRKARGGHGDRAWADREKYFVEKPIFYPQVNEKLLKNCKQGNNLLLRQE